MTASLRHFLRITDIAMLAYWAVSGAAIIGFIHMPVAAMYAGYGTPMIDAWNWSFAPLDIGFAITGLVSVRLAGAGDPRWRSWAIISLVLTMCAGGMAVGFWALLSSFDLSWWIPNVILLLAPLIWLPALLRGP